LMPSKLSRLSRFKKILRKLSALKAALHTLLMLLLIYLYQVTKTIMMKTTEALKRSNETSGTHWSSGSSIFFILFYFFEINEYHIFFLNHF
jgi:hypothetical protein